ncbi:MAG: hypothetical protein RBU30_15960 [Polyangia bacterium]|jgi:hypothetical protein|nr:hypothetical protein [Polyangia bacterium]
MTRKRHETDRVRIHRVEHQVESIQIEEHTNEPVTVVITQVFCANGHNLVGRSRELFDGYPGISLWVEASGKAGEVVVSPVHGDHRKKGLSFEKGTKLSIKCPECKTELEELTRCRCTAQGQLRKLYLTPIPTDAHIIAVCDVWGCPLSRVIDSYEMFSEFLDGNIGDDVEG